MPSRLRSHNAFFPGRVTRSTDGGAECSNPHRISIVPNMLGSAIEPDPLSGIFGDSRKSISPRSLSSLAGGCNTPVIGWRTCLRLPIALYLVVALFPCPCPCPSPCTCPYPPAARQHVQCPTRNVQVRSTERASDFILGHSFFDIGHSPAPCPRGGGLSPPPLCGGGLGRGSWARDDRTGQSRRAGNPCHPMAN